MKWNISFWQKVKAILGLATVFLLVFATNKMDKNHFIEVQKSFTSVYDDRLVAKDHIFKISRLLDIKKNDLISQEESDRGYVINDSIRALVEVYSQANFTKKESESFDALNQKLNALFELESDTSELPSTDIENKLQRASKIIDVLNQLDDLAEIQMTEAKRELDKSNRLIESSNLISRIEIGALILIGLLVQLFIFIKPMK